MKLLIVVVGIIFGPLIILGIAKIISTMSGTVKKTNPFKYVFGPRFIWGVFKTKKIDPVGNSWRYSLRHIPSYFCLWLWPTPEKLAFKEFSKIWLNWNYSQRRISWLTIKFTIRSTTEKC